MQKILASLFLLALTCCVAAAQQDYAYGQPSDLKGLKKVYIDTGDNTKNRDSIIKELEKSQLGFEIVDETADAEIVLGFGAGSVANVVWTTSVASRVIEQRTGAGRVIAFARGKLRLVLAFDDTQNTKWERKPVTNFVRDFIKAYKKGNDLK